MGLDQLVGRFQEALSERYAFERELGRGGMAVVYLARDRKLDRKVAVKLLSPEVSTAIDTERFLREIRITSQLQHPNILTLLDSGEAAGLAYYVMPFVEGESLRDTLRWKSRLPVLEAVRVARQVAGALSHAHAKGVIHRDIKPENILLSDGQAVVADFGIARASRRSGRDERSLTLTVAGVAMGTPAYMSPEQARASGEVDGRSDIYALGCVLFEMLAGRPPFEGLTVESILAQHLAAKPPDLLALRPDIPPDLARVVARSLNKEPDERYGDAGELADDLAVLLASEVLQRVTPRGAGGEASPAATPAGTPTPGRRSATPVTPARTPQASPSAASDGTTPGGEADPAGCPPCAPTLASRTRGGWRFRSRRGPLGLAAALALLALVVWRPWQQVSSLVETRAEASKYVASMVALPLDTIGGGEEAYLSEGLTEEIISQLSRIPGLKVISKTSAVAVKAKGLTVPEIARHLNVRHVLEGSVQRAGDRIRVTLQLIDAKNDAHLWSESYDRELTDILRLREEIGQKVSAALMTAVVVPRTPEAQLASMASGRSTAVASTNPKAVENLMRGKFCLQRTSQGSLANAIEEFRAAIDADGAFAPAYIGLSEALRTNVQLGFRSGESAYRDFTLAGEMAKRAVELDPGLANAYLARGLVTAFAEGPVESVLSDMKKSLDLAPNSAAANVGWGLALSRAGRYEEAIPALFAGADLDPMCPAIRGAAVAMTALGARRYELAAREARTSVEMDEAFQLGRLIEGIALVLLGRYESVLKDPKSFPEARAMALLAADRRPEAETLLASLSRQYERGDMPLSVQPAILASAYAYAGNVEATIRWLEKSHELSPSAADFRVFDSGVYDKVRKDPRFVAAIEKLRKSVRVRVFGTANA